MIITHLQINVLYFLEAHNLIDKHVILLLTNSDFAINNLVTSVNIQYLKKSILIKILKIN